MSRFSKVAFLCAALAAIAALVSQALLGGWINLNSVLLAVAGALVVLAIFWDWKLYWEFFTMRTTKHGMNMGAMILMVITAVVCVNYLANKHNKTLDLTQDKLNSLSDQTTKVLAGLKEPLEIKVFYKGQHPKIEERKAQLRQVGGMYKDASGQVRLNFINAYINQEQAMKYLADQPDRDQAAVVAFVEYKGKKIRVDEPFDESTLTAAMIKATREGESKIYFLKGHGEKDIASDDDQGMREFARALEEASFKVESLELIDRKEIPSDAAVVAIVGPSVPYLDTELQWLREFIHKGGRLFVAADPGVRHNLANLMKPLGVEFANNYVLTVPAPLVGNGPATILGRTFDPHSDVTKSIPEGAGFAIFPLVSELKPAPDKASTIQVLEIVKSDSNSFTLTELTRPPTSKPETKAVTVGVQVKGTIAAAEDKAAGNTEGKTEAKPESKPFEAVIFGDSDFLSNRALMAGVNRDLAMNAFASLANQADLISIRPKIPKGNIVTLTGPQRLFIVIAGLSLPVLLLIASGVMWFRRRGA